MNTSRERRLYSDFPIDPALPDSATDISVDASYLARSTTRR